MARSSLLLGSALAGLVLAAASPTAAQPAIDLDQLTATQAAADLCAGKIIGAVGCSGATGDQDAVACKAGADTVK